MSIVRPSVAQELVLALSQPKTLQQSNNNIKNRKVSVKKKVNPRKKIDTAEEAKKTEKDDQKDKVLKKLMEQVSSLEKTLGDKITKLEQNLESEVARSKTLEESLKKKTAVNIDSLSRMKKLSDNNKELEKKILILTESLKKSGEEQEKYKSETEKLTEIVNFKDAEIFELRNEIDLLTLKNQRFLSWKEKVESKIRKSVQMANADFASKIKNLTEENNNLREKLRNTKLNIRLVTKDISTILKNKDYDMEKMSSDFNHQLKDMKKLLINESSPEKLESNPTTLKKNNFKRKLSCLDPNSLSETEIKRRKKDPIKTKDDDLENNLYNEEMLLVEENKSNEKPIDVLKLIDEAVESFACVDSKRETTKDLAIETQQIKGKVLVEVLDEYFCELKCETSIENKEVMCREIILSLL